MGRTLISGLHAHIGKEVTVMGWVDVRRDHGKLIFIDLRDRSGKMQMIANPAHAEAHALAATLRSEWVIAVTGKINERPEKMMNKNEPLGDIELEILHIEVLNKSDTPPFDITGDTLGVDEDIRLKYRYLDLRTARLQKNMRIRSEFVQKAREFLFSKDFIEIETPLLTESTPEGSRDFVVPSRIQQGKFYALPQSPQQYKQLLMVAGFERYFQIARAVRDEDLRADRGFEHSQIDLEMSFVSMEDVMMLVEELMTTIVESMGYRVKGKPFPRITYQDAVKKHGADKFDLRTDAEKKENVLAYAWITNFPFFEKTDEGGWTFTHNPFSMPISEHVEWLLKGERISEILTTQYDLVCNGFETGGGSIRAHTPEILKATYKVMGYSDKEIEERIGHMLKAFRYGAPPHGGVALGIERNIMNLTGETHLREVQAFPMTRGGQTAVMNAPKELSKKQLDELGIELKKKKS